MGIWNTFTLITQEKGQRNLKKRISFAVENEDYDNNIHAKISDTDAFNDYFPKTESNDNNMNQIFTILHELEGTFTEYNWFLWSLQFAFPDYLTERQSNNLKSWKRNGFYQNIGKHRYSSITSRMSWFLKYIRDIEEITNSANVAMTQIQERQSTSADYEIIDMEKRLQHQLPRTRAIIRSVTESAMSDLAIHIQSENPNLYHRIQQFRENTLQLDINKDLLILDDLFTAFENLSNALQNLFNTAWTQAKAEAERKRKHDYQQYRGDSVSTLIWKEFSKAVANRFGRSEHNKVATLFEFTYPKYMHQGLQHRKAELEKLYDELRQEMANVMEQIIVRYHGKLKWMINYERTPKVEFNVMKGGKVGKDVGAKVSESLQKFWFRVNRMIIDDGAIDAEALTSIFRPFILDIVFQLSPETARVYGKRFGQAVSPTMEHIPEVKCTKNDVIGCIDRFFQLVPKWWLLLNEVVIHANQAVLYTGLIPVNKVSIVIDTWGWLHLQYISAAMISDMRIWFHLELDDALVEMAKRIKHRFEYFAYVIAPTEEICVPYQYRESDTTYPLYSHVEWKTLIYRFLEPLKKDEDIFDAQKLNIQSFNTKVDEIRKRMSNNHSIFLS